MFDNSVAGYKVYLVTLSFTSTKLKFFSDSGRKLSLRVNYQENHGFVKYQMAEADELKSVN